jgi:hypothetical protein
VRSGWGGREEEGRISAVTLWPRWSAEARTRRPVRPVAPMRSMSGRVVVVVLGDMMDDGCVSVDEGLILE